LPLQPAHLMGNAFIGKDAGIPFRQRHKDQ
jgi:hypothetical protein